MLPDPFDPPPSTDPEDAAAADPIDETVRQAHDALLARMNAPGMREKMQAAFDASPEELGQAAVNAAKKASDEGA